MWPRISQLPSATATATIKKDRRTAFAQARDGLRLVVVRAQGAIAGGG